MALILNIDTSTTNCSVSLSLKGTEAGYLEVNDGYAHAEKLHVLTEQLFRQSGMNMKNLDAVALSAGPGSYTGLRIGTSAAKGFCFALKIPLIAVNTLRLMTEAASRAVQDADYYLPMLDARRMEVYCAVYDRHKNTVTEPHARIIDEESLKTLLPEGKLCVFGDGMPKCRDLFRANENSIFINDIIPSARHMHQISFSKFTSGEFENPAYFEPYYLKEYMFAKKQK